MTTTTHHKETAMFSIHRKQIAAGVYEYRYGNDADEDSGHVFISKSKKLYTHIAWFQTTTDTGRELECFQLCSDEQKAAKASKSRWKRAGVTEVIADDAARNDGAQNVELGRKLYATMFGSR